MPKNCCCYKSFNFLQLFSLLFHLWYSRKSTKSTFRDTCKKKKKKKDLENDTTDDEDFHEEGSERHSFNKSMIEINPKWTPIKYQLRTDLNVVSVKKSFFKKVIKQLKAYLK